MPLLALALLLAAPADDWAPKVDPHSVDLPSDPTMLSIVCTAALSDATNRLANETSDQGVDLHREVMFAGATWLKRAEKLTGKTYEQLNADMLAGLTSKLATQPMGGQYQAQIGYCHDNQPPFGA